MTDQPVQSMAAFCDMLVMQGITWTNLEKRCKEEAAKRGTATLASIGQIRAHVKFRSKQAKWDVDINESGVRMNAVAQPAKEKPVAKSKAQPKNGKATGRKVTKTNGNGRQAVVSASKMEKDKVMVLAGMFARSNMGQRPADDSVVTRAKQNPPTTANAAALMFCEQFVETNEHEKIFTDEAKMWIKQLTPMSDEELAKAHPDIAAQYDRA